MLSAFSSRTMQDGEWSKSRYFPASEFRHPERQGYEWILWLNRLRGEAGVPINIFSDYRSPDHNLEVGGAENSAHMDSICNCGDIRKAPTPDDPHWNLARGKIIRAAIKLGCVRIGIYPNGDLHIDRTEDIRPAAIWIQVDNPMK